MSKDSTVAPTPSPWWKRLIVKLFGISPKERKRLTANTTSDNTIQSLQAPKATQQLPVLDTRSHEIWLTQLMSACSEGKRMQEIDALEFRKHLQGLCDLGDELLASQWIEKFIGLPHVNDTLQTALRVRLMRLFEKRGDMHSILDHLQALTLVPSTAADAHFHLAEHHKRRGDERLALREYEAVLAISVDYPNVRNRYERLRLLRGASPVGSSAETMAGPTLSGLANGSRYVLLRELGRGAAGVAYLARDKELEREVAVKLLHPHLSAADQKIPLQNFFDEARVAASLRHPNIVAILDLDEKARRIVMELCDGGTLATVLRDRGALTVRRALQRHAQILSALNAAHARGVVHRDLKPANLMFRRDPDLPGAEIVLGDFGIAHLPAVEGQKGEERASREGAVGTMAYMSPEQRLGKASPKSDLYASAVVLYEMLTGELPWSKQALFAGTRSRGDFTLPKTLLEIQPALGKRLQKHLDDLGDPAISVRPTTMEAMKEARRLRDLAMVLCSNDDPRG